MEEKVQSNTQMRTESELQLWQITAPKRKQIQTKQLQRNQVQRRQIQREQIQRGQIQREQIQRKQTAGRPTQRSQHRDQYRLVQAPGKTAAYTSQTGRYTGTGHPRPIQSARRRRTRRQRVLIYRSIALGIFVLFVVGIFKLTGAVYRGIQTRMQSDDIPAMEQEAEQETPIIANIVDKPDITVNLLEPNPYSRPGDKLNNIRNIFVHYTANKGTSAAQNRSYFANLAESGERSASAHFIIGYEGEIIQCIPLEEEAYAVRGRNDDSVSIECCYLSDDGSFTPYTYNSLIELLSWLCSEYDLSEQDILRHYDEGGKKCPLYYVNHEDEWELLLEDVAEAMEAKTY